MDFMTGLPLFAEQKSNNYDLILVIVDQLTKMMYYKSVIVIIDTPELAEVILDVVVSHKSLPDSIMTDRDSFFTTKFWLSLYYFFRVKQRFLIVFQSWTNS